MLDKVFEVLTDSPPISGKVSLEFPIFTAILSDPRMDRIFVGTPVQMMTIVALYLLFIHKLGPNFMKERKRSIRATKNSSRLQYPSDFF
jgi:hypothetical protein